MSTVPPPPAPPSGLDDAGYDEPLRLSLRDRLAPAAWPAPSELAGRLAGWIRSLPDRAVAARWSYAGTAALWIPLLLVYLGNRPGFMTQDTFDVWRQVVTHDWEDTHPISYVLAMHVSRWITGSPAALAFAQTIFIAAGLAMLARALIRLGTHRYKTYAVTVFLAWTPMVGGFTITLWKDIPYTAAMLGVAARVIDLFAARLHAPGVPVPRAVLGSLFRWGLAVVLFRQNGLFFMGYLGLLLVIAATRRRRELLTITISLGVIFLAVKMVLYPAIGVEKTPDEITLAGFVHDINAALTHNPELFTQDDLDLLAQAMPIKEWMLAYANPYGCDAIIPWYLSPSMNLNAFRGRSAEYRALWRKVLIHAPGTVLDSRLCVASLAWRPQSSGTYLYTITYGKIPDNEYGFTIRPVFKSLRDWSFGRFMWADEFHRQWYTWRAPAVIYAVYAMLLARALWRRNLVWLIPGALLAAQQLNVITLNPAQDARYMFCSYMVGIMLFSLLFYREPGARRGRRQPAAQRASKPVE